MIDSTKHRNPIKREDSTEDEGGRGAPEVEDSIMDESDEEEEVGGMLDGDEDED